jgi:hypothetical protein
MKSKGTGNISVAGRLQVLEIKLETLWTVNVFC